MHNNYSGHLSKYRNFHKYIIKKHFLIEQTLRLIKGSLPPSVWSYQGSAIDSILDYSATKNKCLLVCVPYLKDLQNRELHSSDRLVEFLIFRLRIPLN